MTETDREIETVPMTGIVPVVVVADVVVQIDRVVGIVRVAVVEIVQDVVAAADTPRYWQRKYYRLETNHPRNLLPLVGAVPPAVVVVVAHKIATVRVRLHVTWRTDLWRLGC